jgi:N-succinyldiaminopimelate aminotransferase
VPGLRLGFVAGDPKIIAAFARVRNFGGATVPYPILHAGTALWRDEKHVVANRALYQQKFAMAERLLGNRLGFYKPAGGFFLWLDVGDSEAAARRLYAEAAVTTLPGAYLAKADDGTIGRPYLRVALVNDLPTTEEALIRIRDTLG